MYPFWNPYYPQFMMTMPSFIPIFQPQMFINPAPFVPFNHIVSTDRVPIPEITKNNEKNTEQPSRSIIDISSDSESQIKEIQPSSILDKKNPPAPKLKPDRFLGFKEGIFEKENNEAAKPMRNLRKRAVLTRAQLKKYKEKNGQQKAKERKKTIQKPIVTRKLRQSPRISKKEIRQKNKTGEKKPRNRQFGKLKKYLRGVGKTVDLPEMYTVKWRYLKQLQGKRENLLMRQTE